MTQIITDNCIRNPFNKISILFLNELIQEKNFSINGYTNKLNKYGKNHNIEWLYKNIKTHYQKLLNTVLNILEVQNKFKENEKIDCININWNFTLQNWLEYFFIKLSTLIELTDLFYEKYFNLNFKKKQTREKNIIKEFKQYIGEDITEFRERFLKQEILNIRNRIIHEKGYSIKIYLMEDNIFTFQIYDSNIEEIKEINKIYSYYSLEELKIKPPLIILERYVVYILILFILYIEIFFNFLIKRANIDDVDKYDRLDDEYICYSEKKIYLLKKIIKELNIYFNI